MLSQEYMRRLTRQLCQVFGFQVLKLFSMQLFLSHLDCQSLQSWGWGRISKENQRGIFLHLKTPHSTQGFELNFSEVGTLCEACEKAPAKKDDILCVDCSRAYGILLELLLEHPDIQWEDVARISEIYQWRTRKTEKTISRTEKSTTVSAETSQ